MKRVYYPSLLRDPEIHVLEGVLCALWVHTHPTLSHAPHAHSSLSVATVVPALAALPAALTAIEDLIAGSGGAHLPLGTSLWRGNSAAAALLSSSAVP